MDRRREGGRESLCADDPVEGVKTADVFLVVDQPAELLHLNVTHLGSSSRNDERNSAFGARRPRSTEETSSSL